jgi:hypothetical protein
VRRQVRFGVGTETVIDLIRQVYEYDSVGALRRAGIVLPDEDPAVMELE